MLGDRDLLLAGRIQQAIQRRLRLNDLRFGHGQVAFRGAVQQPAKCALGLHYLGLRAFQLALCWPFGGQFIVRHRRLIVDGGLLQLQRLGQRAHRANPRHLVVGRLRLFQRNARLLKIGFGHRDLLLCWSLQQLRQRGAGAGQTRLRTRQVFFAGSPRDLLIARLSAGN